MRMSCNKIMGNSNIKRPTGISTSSKAPKSSSKGQYILDHNSMLLSVEVSSIKPVRLTLEGGRLKEVMRGKINGVAVERIKFLTGMGSGLPALWSDKLTPGSVTREVSLLRS